MSTVDEGWNRKLDRQDAASLAAMRHWSWTAGQKAIGLGRNLEEKRRADEQARRQREAEERARQENEAWHKRESERFETAVGALMQRVDECTTVPEALRTAWKEMLRVTPGPIPMFDLHGRAQALMAEVERYRDQPPVPSRIPSAARSRKQALRTLQQMIVQKQQFAAERTRQLAAMLSDLRKITPFGVRETDWMTLLQTFC